MSFAEINDDEKSHNALQTFDLDLDQTSLSELNDYKKNLNALQTSVHVSNLKKLL